MRDVKAKGGDLVAYVPEAFGIRRAWRAGEDDAPVTVHIRPLTAADAQRRAAAGLDRKQAKIIAIGGDEANALMADMQRTAFIACVDRVENYSIGGVPILTGADLWDHGEADIVNEVNTAATNFAALDGGARDSSCSQPDSAPAGTSPLAGTVGSAQPRDIGGSADATGQP